MKEINIKELLEEANKYLKDPDAVIDPYDMTFVWMNEEKSKMAGKDLVGKRVASTSEDPYGVQNFREMATEAMTINHNVREKEIVFNMGPYDKKKALIGYITMEFEDQPYIVTKIIKVGD